MSESLVLASDADGIRRLTVHRPDKLNALNAATLDALQAAFTAAADDASVRVVVLTGAGPKAFVAGADIAEMADLRPTDGRDFSLRGQRLMRTIETLPKPVIAMVNGFALGGGLELAMACHLRIAADTAKVGQPEINLGLVPGFGGTQRLTRRVGPMRAKALTLLGEPFDAAVHFGMQDWQGVEYLELMRERVIPAGSPLMLTDGPLPPDRLLDFPLLHLESRPGAWEDWFARRRVPVDRLRGMLFDQFSHMSEAAALGFGVAHTQSGVGSPR